MGLMVFLSLVSTTILSCISIIIEEVKKLVQITINVVLAYCTLCYFQYSLQSALELVFILFTVNT